MKKLLVLTNSILEYRIPVYTELSNYFDLTVAYYDISKVEESPSYKQLKLSKFTIGPICFIKENLFNICSEYEACLVMGDMHVLSFMRLGFLKKRKFSLTYWGGDVSFSYKKKYDEDRRFDFLRFFLMNKADSLVFYCNYPVNRYIKDGHFQKEKLFVANNTVFIENRINVSEEKKHFIFIGTLYKEKKINELLDAYLISYKKNKNLPELLIIGDGDEKSNIEKWISNFDLNGKIFLLGAIYDQSKLEKIFSNSIACISPGQAGLSVLNCMGHGVPFITTHDAITGGEIFNIINNENGIIYNGEISDLARIISYLTNNTSENNRLSKNAQDYYYKNATIEKMVKGLVDSIQFGLLNMKKTNC